MEYLVWIIYVWFITEIGKEAHGVTKRSKRYGREYYKLHGVCDLILGFIGIGVFSFVFRTESGEVRFMPDWAFWVGLVGCWLVLLMGNYCIIRYLFTMEN